ncbi:DUF4124 domain-containing protein [Piscinibacter koreensis]|uniref:DUF4124 domain-containing protein n=1 Tax=Piscinibacter koreensis TaxID=2742824 RepID=A0A7Y6NR79_9BURK|nr:DUF4124 domain-containing protein [Schlegelella koreensis]NUZ07857.1 DUF4124 domain-containing protein [Schlegelella koreensis]
MSGSLPPLARRRSCHTRSGAPAMARGLVLCAGLLSALAPALAADIYRWTDESGRTHLSDVVPERYKRSAQRVDSRQFELSEAERRQGEARAAALRQAAATPASAASAPRGARLGAGGVRSAASGAPTAGSTAPTAEDCSMLQRQYLASQGCFAPCRQANGSINAECAARCPQVVDPSPRCGLPTLQP